MLEKEQMPLRFKARYALLTLAYCVGIFYLSAQQEMPDAVQMLPPGTDKVVHAVLYAGLALVVAVGLRRSNGTLSALAQYGVPVLFAVCYGISDELHQLFVPNRFFELWDLCADAVGAVAMQALAYKWWSRRLPQPAE